MPRNCPEGNSIRNQQHSCFPARVAQKDMVVFLFHAQIAFESGQNQLVLDRFFTGAESCENKICLDDQPVAGQAIRSDQRPTPWRTVYVTLCEPNFRNFRGIDEALFIALLGSVAAIFGYAPTTIFRYRAQKSSQQQKLMRER